VSDSRGASAVVSNLLLIAVVVVLASVISVFALGFAEETRNPGPTVSDSSAQYRTGSTTCDTDIVRLTHNAGDTVQLAETRTIVRLPDSGGTEATITGFPTDGTTLDSSDYDDPGNIVYSNGCVGGEAAEGDGGTGDWAAGTSFSFKLNSGSGDIEPGDTIDVLVVHEPSDAILVKHSLSVRN